MEEEKKSCPKGQVSKSTNISKPKVSVGVGVGREKWPGPLSCPVAGDGLFQIASWKWISLRSKLWLALALHKEVPAVRA